MVKDKDTVVTGDSICFNDDPNNCTNSLTIDYKTQAITLVLTMKYDISHINGYWDWSALTVEGTINGTVITPTGNGDLNVAPVPGYTSSKADINCQRDYTACAPKDLSWTCDNEVFKSKNSYSAAESDTDYVRITFPGLELQPFFGVNETQTLRYELVSNSMSKPNFDIHQ